MRISELAREAGVGVETVRFYETRGLIERPPRPQSGYRDYPTALAERIGFIRTAQRLGFSLDEIDELLALDATSRTRCSDVRGRAEAKLGEVEAKIASLCRIGAALSALIDGCPGDDAPGRDCSILHALRGGVGPPPTSKNGG